MGLPISVSAQSASVAGLVKSLMMLNNSKLRGSIIKNYSINLLLITHNYILNQIVK